MLALFREAVLTAPALVIMGMPLKVATRSSVVLSSGCTASHSFFFCTRFSLAGSGWFSSNQTRSPICNESQGLCYRWDNCRTLLGKQCSFIPVHPGVGQVAPRSHVPHHSRRGPSHGI